MRIPSLSIRNQLLLSLCLVAIIPVGLLGALVSHRVEGLLQQQVSREMTGDVAAGAETLETYLSGVRRDLLSLSRFLQRRLSSHMSPARWREVEEEFYQALSAERSFYQVRFIDTDGWERLRVNNIDGRLVRVPEAEYQDKSGRYYVQEALRLAPGDIYLSPLDFNVEHGRIEVPRKLVTRMATPVAGPKGQVLGIVIVNILGGDLLQLLDLQVKGNTRVLLAGEKGGYVERRRFEQMIRVQTGDIDALARQLGIAPGTLTDGDAYRVFTDGPVLLATAPVRFGPHTWRLIKTVPRTRLDDDLGRVHKAIQLVVLLLFLAAVPVTILLARRFSRPIGKLARFAGDIAGGNYSSQVDYQARDEFGQLSKALNSMAEALETSRHRLLDWNKALQDRVRQQTQELQDSEEKYRLIFAAGSEAILILDTDKLQIEEANDAACRLYGYESGEMIGLNLVEITAEREKSLQRVGEIISGRRSRIDLAFHLRKDGSGVPVSISAGTFHWQNRNMLVGIIRDISESLRLEAIKDEMLAGISHEMVSPLAAVVGFLELLLEDDLTPRQREYLQTCLQEERRLQNLIENLLIMQRLRAGGRLMFETLQVCPLLQEVATAFRDDYGNRSLSLVCAEDLPPITGEAALVRQALANLLANAERFAPAESEIVLGATRENNGVAFWVEDQGPGVPPEQRERIFDKFFRVDIRDGTRLGGTGLGLPLVKEIARVHEGQVRLESRTGQGSTFYLILPAAVTATRKKAG